MAGVKGRSGGARPGAGRPKKAVERASEDPVDAGDRDMLEFLQDVALGRLNATALQVRAAVAAVQYTHTKTHDGGKKEGRKDQASKAATGRFAPKSPPKLVVSNGR